MKKISAIQEPIWLTQNIYTTSTLYNVGGYAFIEGELQESILIRAIEEVVKSIDVIEIGYNAFNESGDNAECAKYDIAAVDFTNAPDPAQSCLDWIHRDISECFDLNGSLFKVRLFKASNSTYYWYTKVHHLIFDGYSMALFFNRVSGLYSKYISGDGEAIEDEVFPYSDFIDDENEYRSSDEYNSDKAFWLNRLSGLPGVRAFESCLKSTTVESLVSKRTGIGIPRAMYNQIDSFCKGHGCTVFHYFISALFILNRYYNNDTPTIGLPVFNRRNKKFKSTLGTFVNMLPFSVSMKEGSTFLDVLYQVRNELKDCYKHQRFPLYDILQELDGQGNIYNVTFSYQRNTYETKLGNAVASINYIHPGEQQEDLVFHLLEYTETEDLTLSVDYKEELFSYDVITNLLSHFNSLLYSLFNNIDQPVSEFHYLSEQEKHQLLVGFNSTDAPYTLDRTVVDLFEDHVLNTPDTTGLLYEDRSFSYRELNEMANRLAHYLRQTYNVSADDLIGIEQERSEWIVISMLAVLKSGGAYVPIDPAYPQDRIDYIIADSQCKVVLDQKELNRFFSIAKEYSSENPAVPIRPSDLAYIIYTSGSTGVPKGVMITHSNVSAFMDWCRLEFGASKYEVVLGATSICFDLSVFEIFYTLASGKQLRLLKDALSIPQYLDSTVPLLINTVPSVVSSLLGTEADLSNVSVLNMAGEPIPLDTVRQLDCNRMEVRNLYGPSEDTTYSTIYRIREGSSILIGCPIANTRIYILNDYNQLQPVGVAGEICISGAGLARGYLNKEALTAERFVSHPFITGERMYRTGDLGRWQADGNIEFLGRKDDQVKIRGYRIELGEIEHILRQHTAVKAAVVRAIKEKSGDSTLAAYIVGESHLDIADIRNWLASKLPHYMVPAYFIQLDALPLLPNGKLNKKALPAPESTLSVTTYVAPRNETEQRLAEVWQEVLGVEQAGALHNFFELGGHSLKATRLVSQLYKVFGVRIALKDVFRFPVLESQALLIAGSQKTNFTAIPAVEQQSSYPLSSSQHRLWILSQFEEGSVAYNMPGVFEFEGALDLNALSRSFDTLIDRHEILRTVFRQEAGGEVRQIVLSESAFTINMHDLRHSDEATITQAVKTSISLPFDLARGPLLRADLYQLGDAKWIFTYVMHHIISDGWSMGVLISELLKLYNSSVQGTPDALQPLRIHYKDYAVWQQQQLNEEAFQQHKRYWLQQLGGELPVLDLPADKPRPAVKTYNGASLHGQLSADLTKKFKAVCHSEESTLFMGLLATIKALLYRYTSQEDMIIGSPIANREHSDLEDQIGFYVNTLALRTQFSGTDTYRQLLSRVRQTTLDAYAHQAYPFDALVEDLDLQRDMSRSALFDVLVVLQHQSEASLLENALTGLQVRTVESPRELSKFDLQFTFVEEQDAISTRIIYNTDIYHQEMIAQLLDNFIQLLEAVIADPAKPIATLNYLSAATRQKILGFNKAIRPAASITLTSAFAQQVEHTPNHTALVFEQTALTYFELDEESNKLATYLGNTYGLQSGDLAAIKLERSEWMIVALLGILKCGAAFVPIDTAYPQERIDYILSDSNCRVVIDKEVLDQYFTNSINTTGEIADTNTPGHLAYVIYTSGSTGRPKGVMIRQGALHDYIAAISKEYGISKEDRILQISNFAFDAAVEQIMVSLLNGATLYVASQALTTDTDKLTEYIAANAITHLHSVPTLLQHIDFTKAAALKRIVSAGEDCPLSLPQKAGEGTSFYNKYGPTEATISATIYKVTQQEHGSRIPVGHPLENSRVYILNDHHQLQPIGAAGEICIGGNSLAQGYLNKPELTAEKFINDPYEAGQLIYRTGDLGKWRADGNIVFLGRKDDQVKVRGHRIELGEITQVLQQYEGIEKAVVNIAKDAGGDNTLAAYIVAKAQLSIADIRNWLASKLPHYMVPAYFMQLEALPLLPNGKLNKKALPAPEAAASATTYVAPRNEIETQLVQIWQEVLGVEQVGVLHNFFELGGHSLKATRLAGQLHRVFGVKIALKDVFQLPVLESQALLIASSQKASFTAIPAVEQQSSYPLSSSQHRLWILSQFEESNIAYNMPGVFEFEGALDMDVLSRSFNAQIDRHEILRTVFRQDADGEIRQIVIPELAFTINEHDLRKADKVTIEEQVRLSISRSFDLAQGPLLRADLYQIGDDKWIFTYVMHHIISDGWSMGILIRELMQLYNASVQGILSPFQLLRIHYKDYALWQQQQLNEESFQQHKNYWLQQLSGELPVLDLTSDKPRPAVKTYNGAILHKKMDAGITAGLKTLCESTGSTLFMGLLATVKALLYRYTSQEDMIIGSPIANREHSDLEDQIGFYVNTLALRTQFSGRDTYRQLLSRVRQTTLDAYVHQAYPFDALVDDLDLQRDMSRNALFDIMVVLQHQSSTSMVEKGLSGLQIRAYEVTQQVSKFDLQFSFVETGDQLGLYINYNTDLYYPDTIIRLSDHLEQLLASVIASPEEPIGTLNYLSLPEQTLLESFNDTDVACASDKTIVDLIEQQVLYTPDAVAVVYGEKILSYRELSETTSQLARYLKHTYNIEAGDLVAVGLERSEWLPLAILGILKAGAAYIPIDTAYPQERIHYIIKDGNCKVFFDTAELKKFRDVQDNYDTTFSSVKNNSGDIAYCIYTSGSTGTPKGVLNTHGGIYNRLVWMKEYLDVTAHDVFLQKTPYTFDVSVWELLLPFMSGSSLVVAAPEKHKDPLYLQDVIAEKGVTIAHFVPSMLGAFLPDVEEDKCTSLKHIVCSGEELPASMVVICRSRLTNTRIHNLYGPTEAAVDVTAIDVTDIDVEQQGVSIGFPIANTKIYIVNEFLQLQPVGVAGELLISGVQVAKGYLHLEELTTSRFINDPFIPGNRVYRSGDLARWLPNGTIQYLGRMDNQVKIRGNRIELGEVEKVLSTFESIEQAVVAVRKVNEEKVLVAYYTAAQPIDKITLRQYLQQKLPEYMVPAYYVALTEVPLTASGKVDRKALPVIKDEDVIHREYVAPRTVTEQKLVDTWQGILKRERIGVRDNFFELGGHSLKATRLASQVHKLFGVKVALKDLFQLPVLEDQARFIEASQKTGFATIPRVPSQPSYVLSSSQRRLWILSQFEESSISYNMPGVFELEGTLDTDALSKAFDALVERHEILRTVFYESGDGEIRQIVLPATAFTLNKHDLRKADKATIQQRVQSNLSVPFDLVNGPLLRADLYQCGGNKWIISYVMHHIISDGWSMGVLIKDLLQLYTAYTQGTPARLQPLSVHYKDYAAWQQDQLTEESFVQHKEYWLQQLSGELPVLDLPTDKLRPAIQTHNGASLHKQIDAGVARSFKALARSEESTLFMGLLAAVNTLLYRYTNQEDIIIGSPIAGREHSDLEDQIGFYVNTLALRTQFSGGDSYRQLLSRVKQTTLDGYAHQAYPFDALVEELALQRDLSRNALFDVLVVLQDEPEATLLQRGLSGLQVRAVDSPRELSKFDLQFSFTTQEDIIGIKLTYNTDVYHADMIGHLLDSFVQLVEAIIADPDKPIGALKYLSEATREKILGFNKTTACKPSTITAAFEEQALQTPDAIALVFEQTALTYRRLNEEAHKLGRYLCNTCQLQPNELAGIQLQRSEWMIIALLAILKRGAAFVPIDPAYPKERIDYIIADSNCRVVIDEEVLSDYLANNITNEISTTEEPAAITPGDLAYVIYTSGSTGRPKGVMIPHGALHNYITAIGKEYSINNQDRVVQVSSFAFDAAIEQIMLSLLNGAALYVPAQSLATNTDELTDYIKANDITHLHSVPTLLQHLDFTKTPALKRVISAGEECPASLVRKVSGSTSFYNKYGPTEATISATLYKAAEKQHDQTKIPIGRPLNNSRVYILNDHQELQPIGVPGEICIGGHSLAKGYLHQPELTALKFINDPYQPGQLIYRTGDLGKWLPDGNIVFLGRKDDQVKIRGHRIELGEIMQVLQEYDGIETAVVSTVKEKNGQHALVAYVVHASQPDIAQLRNWLSTKLPHYMVPAHFIQLDALPLLPNGKLNKKALPAPGTTESAIPYVAPRNEIEAQLAEIWQQVLGLEKVGVQHNFFELGGHSLNATRLAGQVQKQFGINVNIKDVFLNPTIETVGGLIRARLWLGKPKDHSSENRMLVEI